MTHKSDIYAGHENLADMVIGHISSVIHLIRIAKDNSPEKDDALFCDHEIKAMQEISAACEYELRFKHLFFCENETEMGTFVQSNARKVRPR